MPTPRIARELREPEDMMLLRLPTWLMKLAWEEGKRRGTGTWRLIAAALERELVHDGRPVEMPRQPEPLPDNPFSEED